jgi:D-glycero-D-manno-heptose 1,7-bisphosphate phosphatase
MVKTSPSPLSPAIFLDRDVTINEDPGYLNNPKDLKLFLGVEEALSQLKKAGYFLIVVSNQSGVGRGLIEKNALVSIHEKLDALLGVCSIKMDGYYLCFHRPEDDCGCRKPKTKLILDAAQDIGIDLARSFMVGDKESDLMAGNSAGCKGSILVRTGYGAQTETLIQPGQAVFVADSLVQAVQWILDNP